MGEMCLIFHTFSPSEDRWLLLLVKTLDRQTPEDVVGVDLETLGVRVQELLQHRSGRHDQEVTNVNR